MPNFIAVDFYCGAGGTTRGLLDAGGYVIAGIDKDEKCRKTYERNNVNETLDTSPPKFMAMDMFPASPNYPEGQQSEVWERLNILLPHYRQITNGVPLLFAICAPCQSFTKFKQHRMTPERTEGRERDKSLLSETVKFIEIFRPEMVISENVDRIGSGIYKPIWDDFQTKLRTLGYAVGTSRVCASRFGVPQYRKRSFLMAYTPDHDPGPAFDIPIPNHDPDAPPKVSARDAIGHLPALEAGGKCVDFPNHTCRNLSEISRKRLMSVKPGEPNFGFAKSEFGDLSLACHGRLEDTGKRGFSDVYTRIHPGRPSPTITTRFLSVSNGRFGHFDESQIRGLSLHEGALLQSFREDYRFYAEGMDTIAKMIGNAVPPKLSKFMAQWLYGLWSDNATHAAASAPRGGNDQ